MNEEQLNELINYTQVCTIIRKTDLLNYDEKDKLQLYLTNFRDSYKDLQNRINKAIKITESYNLGKFDYSIPTIGIIELLETLKGE